MITTDILFLLNVVLLFLVAILAVKLADCGTRLNRVEESCDVLENVAEGLSDRCDAHKKSIEYLSKSVRELNGVVEAAVKVKERTSDNKPDTKALMGGWTADGTKTTWLDDILAKIRKEKEKPVDDAYYLGVGVDGDKMLKIPGHDTGQTLVDGEPIRHGRLWTNSEGRIYELPEGCFISGDTSYEMDQ